MEAGHPPPTTVVGDASEGVMLQVAADLRSLATVVEGVITSSTPTVDLLEVSRAIQMALVLVNDWRAA